VDDRGKLSLVPVEVVEREAAGEDLGGGDDHRSRDADRGERRDRDRGDRGGDRPRGDHYRTRERHRGPRNS
jgi:polyribonucleotide nucleotidyltransferase